MKRQHPTDPNGGRFPKGHVPWNAGTEGIIKSNSGSFKNDMIPWNKTPIDAIEPTERICRECKEVKNIEEFGKVKDYAFGRSYTCKQCKSHNAKKRYAAGLCYQKKGREILSNEERQIKIRASKAGWIIRNPERAKEPQRKKVDELRDRYILRQCIRNGLGTESIEYIRQRIIMKRTLKQLKEWREENEPDRANGEGKQRKDEESNERGVST